MHYSENILDYWFGIIDPETGLPVEDRFQLWFGKSEETDQFLSENYKELLESAKSGDLDSWIDDPRQLMALVIILDQFSRNIYRDTPEMYAADQKALALAKKSIAGGHDKSLPTTMRVFLYMPFMHSEDLADQEECIKLFQDLHDTVHPKAQKSIQMNIDYAIRHRDIIAKYGRFPHRNKILGRSSTEEEKEYLAQPGAGF